VAESEENSQPEPPRKKRWIRPEIRYTLSAVILLFVVEYLLLPEIASARHNLHVLADANYGL
jgi:hypothetical protein